MIIPIKPLPDNVIGFTAAEDVTADDFKNTVIPAVEEFMKDHKDLNYLLSLNTSITNFTVGSWLQDALLGLKNMTNWNRAAILTESKGIKIFTDVFSKVMPGEFRVYSHDNEGDAIHWLSTGN